MAVLLVWASACGSREVPTPPADPLVAEPSDQGPEPSDVIDEEAQVAPSDRVVLPARHIDERADRSPTRVRRLVYRFEMKLPWALGRPQPGVPMPSGELTVDIAGPRLRARFSGGAFPVDEGSEVRMRIDEPGVYVVDARHAHPVTPGQLAAWFQDGQGSRTTEMVVRQSTDDDPKVIEFVCRLFSEWAGTTMAAVRRACVADGLPTQFTFGAYRVSRTAEAYVTLPERALRADHLDLPRLRHEAVVLLHETEMRARLAPSPETPPERHEYPDAPTVTDGAVVENRVGSRVLVTVSGVPLAWLDSGARAELTGLRAGGHLIGAMHGLGTLATRTRKYLLPGFVVLNR